MFKLTVIVVVILLGILAFKHDVELGANVVHLDVVLLGRFDTGRFDPGNLVLGQVDRVKVDGVVPRRALPAGVLPSPRRISTPNLGETEVKTRVRIGSSQKI